MVKIGNDINTIEFQAQNSSILSNHSIIYRFFKKNERLVINSQNADVKHNNLNILHHNHITTPHIRNKIYNGTTELIIVDGDKNIFTIPDKMYLINNTNGQNNYISTQELHGTFSHEIESNLPFAVNDDDLFISGDNLFFLQQDNYLKITKNSHLIYTKQPADMQKNKQNKPVVYDIKSEKMQAFGNENYATFYKDVVFVNNNNIAKSQFAKVYFNDSQQPTDVFLSTEVDVYQEKNHATSDFGYFDINNDLIILYKNAHVNYNTNQSNGDFYIYNTKDKSIIAFNEFTILPKNEQIRIHAILRKIAKEVNIHDRRYILYVIESNKKHTTKQLQHNSENYNVDRTKRTKMNIFN